jgi:hypothetical protein
LVRRVLGIALALAGCSSFGAAPDTSKDASAPDGGASITDGGSVGIDCAKLTPPPDFCDDFENETTPKGSQDRGDTGTFTIGKVGPSNALTVKVTKKGDHANYGNNFGLTQGNTEVVLSFDLLLSDDLASQTELEQLYTPLLDGAENFCAIQTQRSELNEFEVMDYCSKTDTGYSIAKIPLPTTNEWVNALIEINFQTHNVNLTLQTTDGTQRTQSGHFSLTTWTAATLLKNGIGFTETPSSTAVIDNIAAYRR